MVVEHLNLSNLGFKTYSPGLKGQQSYGKDELYTYGYLNGIKSSRKLEKECKWNIELMWLINSITLDHGTISAFLKENRKAYKQIMKKNLVVQTRKFKKYNSYEGEISEPVENIVNRNFHAEKPDKKMLADITEFFIPAGKVYLSTLVDCFVLIWKISTSPNTLLVNTMLDE